MKLYLTIFFLLFSTTAFTCSCGELGSISASYKRAALVFYGKHLETKESSDFHDIDGRPYKIENFEVYTYYKSLDSSLAAAIKHVYKLDKIIVSLKSTCKYPGADDCGRCFEKGKNYLVYAYRDDFTGLLSTNSCTRTREIIDKNFKIVNSYETDNGKEEAVELLKLFKAAGGAFAAKQWPETFENFYKEIYIEKVNENRRLKTYLYLLGGLSILLFVILFAIIIRQKSVKG